MKSLTAKALALLAIDTLLVLAFAAIGRRSHEESSALVGVLVTAWPFLAGIAVGWLISITTFGAVPGTVRHGIPVWLSAVVVGMYLRDLTGRGIAASFVVVALVVLGAFLLGWRALAGWLNRWEGPGHA
ncbi:DUF3054 domain-containing protein [Oryzihumus leptocrescens]|uniref:DUF3054 family protein n=1 Tax=Oryzihumus leptocrescens TaxID=297536 RepID=A0A542ZJ04_9MICO|nr:DUF3054 domain-containing protein [Oryzihumus leptocrescens]TQL60289.1 DUF3054 family protein [Oryzihumus leptocrescens]